MQPTKREDILAIEVIGWRQEDEVECNAMNGTGCAENCYTALDRVDAETYTIMNEGYPVGMFGVVPLLGEGIMPGWGTVWLLASPQLYEIRRDFMKQSHAWVNHLQRFYPNVTNYVHVDNAPAIRWCRYVGFVFDVAKPHGIAGETFMQIVRSI